MKRDDAIVEPLHAQLAAQGVRYLFAQFTDGHCAEKARTIPLDHPGGRFAAGAGFAGASIRDAALPRHGARPPRTLHPLEVAPRRFLLILISIS